MVSVLLVGSLLAQTPEPDRVKLFERMESRAPKFTKLSHEIWEYAEVGYKETKSSAALKNELRAAGFSIQEGMSGIPTAFAAVKGSGKPVIAIIGEFDALPGLSQISDAERKPVSQGMPGHGCGHNLFGAASAHAAISAAEYLESNKRSGTIKFLGTPAEEGGGGKIYMARAGALEGVDIALAWHPGDANQASTRSTLANITAKFRFRGRASHAAMAPEEGRSSLDAVMVMTHAVELMREHIPSDTRIHYIITNGGAAPNVVPDFAEVYIYARHHSMSALGGIWDRVVKCAEAGALATETKMEMELVSSVYNLLPNGPLSTLFEKNLKLVGGVHYDRTEVDFAKKLQSTLGMIPDRPIGSVERIQPADAGSPAASTDFSDVSWIVPSAQFNAATWVPGTPAHSWQAVACSGTTIGQKGMMVAAKTLALTAIDILNDPKHVEEARRDFDERHAGHQYQSRIPANQKPPLMYRDKGSGE